MTDRGARGGLLAVSGGALLWGTTGVPVAIVHERTGLSALTIGCLRLIVAALVIAAVFGRRLVPRVRAAIERHGWWLVVAGVGLGTYQALYFVGIQYVGVTVSTLVSLAIAPVLLAAWGSWQRRALPDPVALLILSAAIAGLVLVTLRPGASADGPNPTLGLLASLAAGVAYAASTVVNQRLAGAGDPLLLAGTSSAVGAVALVPVALVAGLRWPHDLVSSGWIVYIGVVTTVVAYGLFYQGLRTVSSESAGVLTLLEPLAAAVLAALVLQEQLTALAVVGGVLLLAAIAGLYARPASPEVTPDGPVMQ